MPTLEPRCEGGYGCDDCGACLNTHISRKNLLDYIDKKITNIEQDLDAVDDKGDGYMMILRGMRAMLIDLKQKIDEP